MIVVTLTEEMKGNNMIVKAHNSTYTLFREQASAWNDGTDD
jgi:hypothetical protein